MRRFLSMLGALALIVVVALGIGLGVVFYKGQALDAESKAFVDRAVPAIAATWSKQELLDRATPELGQIVRPEQLNALFAGLSRLGPLVEYGGAKGDARMSYMVGSGSTVSASYVAKARFQNGTATFRIVLVKRDGRWMIQNFHADSAPGDQPEHRT